ncbi:hypothetical protein R3P38DRAFT_1197135 [Favolaschia claudopus]|uniref:Uncharacterized protein n=1 Tax=Favolaschia claudopus TaxID=2862362 RepID=A0AAW0B462_9AGAR
MVVGGMAGWAGLIFVACKTHPTNASSTATSNLAALSLSTSPHHHLPSPTLRFPDAEPTNPRRRLPSRHNPPHYTRPPLHCATSATRSLAPIHLLSPHHPDAAAREAAASIFKRVSCASSAWKINDISPRTSTGRFAFRQHRDHTTIHEGSWVSAGPGYDVGNRMWLLSRVVINAVVLELSSLNPAMLDTAHRNFYVACGRELAGGGVECAEFTAECVERDG